MYHALVALRSSIRLGGARAIRPGPQNFGHRRLLSFLEQSSMILHMIGGYGARTVLSGSVHAEWEPCKIETLFSGFKTRLFGGSAARCSLGGGGASEAPGEATQGSGEAPVPEDAEKLYVLPLFRKPAFPGHLGMEFDVGLSLPLLSYIHRHTSYVYA